MSFLANLPGPASLEQLAFLAKQQMIYIERELKTALENNRHGITIDLSTDIPLMTENEKILTKLGFAFFHEYEVGKEFIFFPHIEYPKRFIPSGRQK